MVKKPLRSLLSRNKSTPGLKKAFIITGKGFFLLLFVYFNSVNAQVNLVQNPGFELISGCPQFPNSIKLAQYWDTLKSGGGCGPELYNSCSTNASLSVPSNGFSDYQVPRSGVSYSLMTWYLNSTSNLKEYIQNTLVQTLTSGKTYCLTFYVCLSNRSKYAIDELGAYFDDGSISTGYCQPLILTPHIKSPTGVFLSDTLNWIKIQGTYVANGTEKYAAFGRFSDNAGTNNMLVNPSGSGVVADYYIDDVSLIQADLPAYAGNDTTIVEGDSIYIGRPHEIGMDDNCCWYVAGSTVAFDTAAGVWVQPDSSTTFIVEQKICGFVSYDTVNVYVNGLSVPDVEEQLSVNLFPNPASAEIFIQPHTPPGGLFGLLVRDNWGRVVMEEITKLNSSMLKLNVSDLESGVYTVTIIEREYGAGATKKIIVMH